MGQTSSTKSAVFEPQPADAEILERDLRRRILKHTEPNSPAPDVKDLNIDRLLGSGNFGLVLGATHISSGTRYALKIVSHISVFKWPKPFRRLRLTLRREREIQIAMNFRFIVKMFWYIRKSSYLIFVMEHAPYGTLRDMLGDVTEDQTLFIVAQLVLALEYLQTNNVVHRDIKLDNIFVAADGYIRLGDFGMAKKLKDGRTYSRCGTVANLAPEVLDAKTTGYGLSADWYSLGTCMYHLLYGEDAIDRWAYVKPEEADEVIRSGRMYHVELDDPNNPMGYRAATFLNGLTEVSIPDRLGIVHDGVDTVKKHVWLARYDFATLYAKQYRTPLVYSHQSAMPQVDWRTLPRIPEKIKKMFERKPQKRSRSLWSLSRED